MPPPFLLVMVKGMMAIPVPGYIVPVAEPATTPHVVSVPTEPVPVALPVDEKYANAAPPIPRVKAPAAAIATTFLFTNNFLIEILISFSLIDLFWFLQPTTLRSNFGFLTREIALEKTDQLAVIAFPHSLRQEKLQRPVTTNETTRLSFRALFRSAPVESAIRTPLDVGKPTMPIALWKCCQFVVSQLL